MYLGEQEATFYKCIKMLYVPMHHIHIYVQLLMYKIPITPIRKHTALHIREHHLLLTSRSIAQKSENGASVQEGRVGIYILGK